VGNLFAKTMPFMTPAGYVGIWWFHSVLVMVFIAGLPHMKLKHIVIAVPTAAGSPEKPMGELAPISMEEAMETGIIGVSTADQYSRWHLMSLDACMSCGRCTEVCPAHGAGKKLNPKQVAQDIHGAITIGANVAATVSEESLWACTTCNACVEVCPVLIRHVDLIVDARRSLVAEGKLSGSAATMLRQVGSTGNAWGQTGNREDWMKGLEVPLARDKKAFETLFWVGCAGATDPGAIKATKAVAELLLKGGVDFACLGNEEACTGDPARRVGDEFQFQELAQQNIGRFKGYEFRRIVTACPHCLNTFRNEYPQFEGTYEVVHHTQLLQELIASGKLKAANPAKGEVTYHDPCYLGRINNESDAPRALVGEDTSLNDFGTDLIRTLADKPRRALAEPEHFGRKTLCCGAGGGRMWMDEEPHERPAARRAQELVDTGAKTVALGCPFCRIMLDASIKQVTEEEINLVDLAEMVRDANK
jgi:Fe-S oxidoreductase